MEWFAALFIRLAVMALLAGAAELLVPEGALRGRRRRPSGLRLHPPPPRRSWAYLTHGAYKF